MNLDYITPKEILENASVPAKPSRLREDIYYDEEDNEYTVQFMLSGDFIEFNSHAEPDMCHQYEPFSNEAFTGYNPHLPCFMLALKEYCMCDISEVPKQNVNIGKALFRTKIPCYEQVMTLYFFKEGTILEKAGIIGMAMVYNQDVEGTPLEEKLLSALEEAVRTYKEIKIE